MPVGRIEMSTSVASMPYQGYSLNNGVQADLSYPEVNYNRLHEAVSVGGGVRIKGIKNYTGNNTVASIKKYSYLTKNGGSSGKLINPQRFANSNSKYFAKSTAPTASGIPNNENCKTDELSSYNTYNYASSGYDIAVGYSRIETEVVAPSNNARRAGKTIFEFNNEPVQSFYPDFFYPQEQHYTNGKLAQKTILNSSRDTLSVEKNTYSVDNKEEILMNVHVQDNYIGPTDVCISIGDNSPPVNAYAFNGRFLITVYPTNSYTVHLTQQDEATYAGSRKIEKTTLYKYDPLVYKPSKITEVTGNKNRITDYVYGIDHYYMEIRNMVGIPIEETVSMGTDQIQRKEWNYILSNDVMILSTVSIQNGTNAPEERLKYDHYDSFGNPRFISKDNATNIVYIWGYNYQYPVAKIENATYDQVKSIIPEATMDAIVRKMAPTVTDMDQINSLRTNPNLKGAFVTVYWYNPLVGIKQVKDPAGKDIFFEYDTFNRLKETYIMENGSKKIVEGYDYYIKQ